MRRDGPGESADDVLINPGTRILTTGAGHGRISPEPAASRRGGIRRSQGRRARREHVARGACFTDCV